MYIGEPTRDADVRRFLGMKNQMSKFLPSLADMTQLLSELLKANTQWIWTTEVSISFSQKGTLLQSCVSNV